MLVTTVGTRYRITIPKVARERAGLRTGQRLAVAVRGNVISLVPLVPLEELRGLVSDIDATGLREKVHRL